MPKISTYVIITSNNTQMDFDECTASIGIQPTKTARSKVASLPGAEWAIGFDKHKHFSVNLALDELFSMMFEYVEKIQAFASQKEYDVIVLCTIEIMEDVPPENKPLYEINKKHIKTLAKLDAEFRLDIYDYSEYL